MLGFLASDRVEPLDGLVSLGNGHGAQCFRPSRSE